MKEKIEKKKFDKSSIPYVIVIFSILVVYCLFFFTLLYMALSTSLKTFPDYQSNRIGLPTEITFENFVSSFELFKVIVDSETTVYLAEMLFNSVIYSVGCAVVASLVPCIVAYLVAKYNFKFNKIVYGTVIISMVLPIVGALPSEIQVMKFLGLYNSMIGIFIKNACYLGTYFLVYYATFKALSNEYLEAAFVDGSPHLKVMLGIVFPLIKTTVFAVFVINFIAYWNDYQSPLIYLKKAPTAAVGLFKFMTNPSQAGGSLMTSQMAGCIILFIPIFILFLCCKNIFLGNLTVGGIKG